jgi:hypothetical protein
MSFVYNCQSNPANVLFMMAYFIYSAKGDMYATVFETLREFIFKDNSEKITNLKKDLIKLLMKGAKMKIKGTK